MNKIRVFQKYPILARALFLLLVTVLLTACGASFIEAQGGTATPPEQPSRGPGGTDYAFAAVKSSSYGSGALSYWIFEPDTPSPVSAPVVIFNHGFLATDPSLYKGWIEHLARKGNIVIFPVYQEMNTSPDLFTENSITAVKNALAELQSGSHVKPNLDKVAVMGHSAGGALSINMAARAATIGLPVPKAILLAEASDASDIIEGGLFQTDLASNVANALLLAIVGDSDSIAGNAFPENVVQNATQIPAENKNIVLLHSDNHGSPGLTADHMAALAPGDSDDSLIDTTMPLLGGKIDALDYYGFWKLTDALIQTAFGDSGMRKYALGNTSEQRYMGRWSDGVLVTELEVLYPSNPSPLPSPSPVPSPSPSPVPIPPEIPIGGGDNSPGNSGGGGSSDRTYLYPYMTANPGVFTSEASFKSYDGLLRLTFPVGVKAQTIEGWALSYVSINPGSRDEPPLPSPDKGYIIGQSYKLGPGGATFNPAASISMLYKDDQIPAGVFEKDLVIGYWDENTQQWTVLANCVVDINSNTISSPLTRLGTYTILGFPPLPAPASFSVANLTIKPLEARIGEEVQISASVTNTGGSPGSYTAQLKINDVVADNREITLEAGQSIVVDFKAQKSAAGQYSVFVAGLTAQFTIKNPEPIISKAPATPEPTVTAAPAMTSYPTPTPVNTSTPSMPAAQAEKTSFPTLWIIIGVLAILAITTITVLLLRKPGNRKT